MTVGTSSIAFTSTASLAAATYRISQMRRIIVFGDCRKLRKAGKNIFSAPFPCVSTAMKPISCFGSITAALLYVFGLTDGAQSTPAFSLTFRRSVDHPS